MKDLQMWAGDIGDQKELGVMIAHANEDYSFRYFCIDGQCHDHYSEFTHYMPIPQLEGE